MFRFTQTKFAIIILLSIAYYLLPIHQVNAFVLVPCGRDTIIVNGVIDDVEQCKLCHLFVLIKNIIEFMVKLSFPLAGLMFAWGGIMLIFGGKIEVGTAINPKSALVAKRIMTSAVMGIIIVLVAWVLIDTILVALTGSSRPPGFPWPWYDIGCPT